MSTNKQRGLLVFIGTSVTTTLVSAFTKSDNYLSLLEVPVLSRATTISLLLNLCVCVTCVCYLCVLPVCVTCVCYPLPNGGFELPVSPVCVTPHHKTVVAVNAPSARVTEGAPIKNTLSLPNSAQTHQNDDDGLLTHPQDLDAPYRSVLSKCSLRVREAECAHSSGGRGKHVDVQLSHMYVFSHVCILTCMYSHMYVFSHMIHIGLLHAPHWLPRTSDCLQTTTNHCMYVYYCRTYEKL